MYLSIISQREMEGGRFAVDRKSVCKESTVDVIATVAGL